MTDPVRVIAESVRTRARRGTLVGAPEEAVQEELRRYAEHAFASDVPLIADERRAERQIVADLTGFGQLQPLLDDPTVEEIWIDSSIGRRSSSGRGSDRGVRHRFVSGEQGAQLQRVRRLSGAVVRIGPEVGVDPQSDVGRGVAERALNGHDVAAGSDEA